MAESLRLDEGDGLDLGRWIRPGDRVMWGQGSAEPLSLIEALVAQRGSLGGVRVFLVISFSNVLKPAHADHLSFEGLGGLGSYAGLARHGLIDVHPVHFSQFCRDVRSGARRADVFFVQLAGPDASGRYSLGADHGYSADAIRHARVVIAEVNEHAPFMRGQALVDSADLDVIVRTRRPMAEMPLAVPDDADRAIAGHILPFIEDGTTIQVGIGGVPSAILQGLAGHRDLGVHTGMLSDPVLRLMRAGVITNARKPIDRGQSVCCALYGSSWLYAEAPREAALSLHPGCYTHDAATMAKLDRFVTVNSALEVDLGGQVNAEYAGRYVGGVGGQVDFVRGARLAARGRSIIALRSRTSGGKSRIVPALSGGIVTTARSDTDIVATEWGVAQLAGKSLRDRERALVALAHPDDRELLERSAREAAKAGA